MTADGFQQAAPVRAKPAHPLRAAELERYLHERIPLSRALAVSVVYVGPELVRLAAPLAPNVNHRQTAFGGSVASLAILAGWSWLLVRVADRSPLPRLVIQEQTVEYVAPIDAQFEAACPAPPDAAWKRFVRALDGRGRGRLELTADVTCGGRVAARFRGLFVAMSATAADDA
jgi:thioesterase domain-containing protein